MKQIENFLRKIFVAKFPPLNQSSNAALVRFLPWLLLAFGALGVLSWVVVVGVAGTTQQMSSLTLKDYLILYTISPASALLSLIGGYKMRKKSHSGWRMAVVSTLCSLLNHLAYASFLGVVLDIFFLYALMQIEEHFS